VVITSNGIRLAWLPQRLQLAAVAGFALVFALLLVVGRPGVGVGQLFFVPILFAALAGGRRAGVVAGVVASVLYATALVAHVPATEESLLSLRVGLHLASYVAAGAIVGTFAARARGLLGESLHMLDVLLAVARRDVESGALSPDGLDTALAQRVSRSWPFALLVGELESTSDERRPVQDRDGIVREAVMTLNSHLGPDADVARAGPTRLVVLSAATSSSRAREAATTAERVLDRSGRRATFGWAFYPSEGADGLALLQSASERLYARRIVRGEWNPTAASAELVDELPARRAASES
jgi:hypothetical protein